MTIERDKELDELQDIAAQLVKLESESGKLQRKMTQLRARARFLFDTKGIQYVGGKNYAIRLNPRGKVSARRIKDESKK